MKHNELGTVYLVGAGPGDIGLLTNKGLSLLKSCDCLVYDRLIQDEMLALAPANCERIYVGKAASDHAMPQEEINLLLCEKAKTHRRVVRLKGGDPYVFGRGGEEGEQLRELGVPFEVVPGISSSIGGLAYAGIPITHRNFASSFHVFTGHFKDDSKDHDWTVVSKLEGTLVFLMSISSIPYITKMLCENGKPGSTPIAVVSNAASPKQEVFEATLANATQVLPIGNIKSPALLVVGEVIKMRSILGWYEQKPLFGKNIIVTRATAQSSRFAEMLREKGATAIELPMIEIKPRDFELSIEQLKRYTHLFFTSENGVNIFMKQLFKHQLDARALSSLKVLAIGPSTAKILESYGILADFVPERFTQEGVIELMSPVLKADDNVLIPSASATRSNLEEWLTNTCHYQYLPIYDTVRTTLDEQGAIKAAKALETADYITFASASAVDNFHAFVTENNLSLSNKAKFASIGPVTTEALKSHGHKPSITATPHTLASMLKKIMEDVR